MSTVFRALWLFGFLAVLAGPLTAAELSGKVVGVHDGDTLTLLVTDGASFKRGQGAIGRDRHPGKPPALRSTRQASIVGFGLWQTGAGGGGDNR